MFVTVCVRERERERVGVCERVCVCESECECVRKGERASASVCGCLRPNKELTFSYLPLYLLLYSA